LWFKTSGSGIDHLGKRPGMALEIGDQQLDPASRRLVSHGADGCRKVGRAAVRQIVAIHRRDHHVLEAELRDRAPDPQRLLAVLPGRPAVPNGTVAAVPRADIAQDHEGGREIFPALADVRAASFLADGVEIPRLHQALQAQVLRPTRRAHLEPRRLGRVGRAQRLEKRQGTPIALILRNSSAALWHIFSQAANGGARSNQ
jgi:hypothetical protein